MEKQTQMKNKLLLLLIAFAAMISCNSEKTKDQND